MGLALSLDGVAALWWGKGPPVEEPARRYCFLPFLPAHRVPADLPYTSCLQDPSHFLTPALFSYTLAICRSSSSSYCSRKDKILISKKHINNQNPQVHRHLRESIIYGSQNLTLKSFPKQAIKYLKIKYIHRSGSNRD